MLLVPALVLSGLLMLAGITVALTHVPVTSSSLLLCEHNQRPGTMGWGQKEMGHGHAENGRLAGRNLCASNMK